MSEDHAQKESRWSIRQATEADHEAIDEINRRAWIGGITTHELLERRHGQIDGRPWVEHITDAVATHLTEPDVTTFVADQGGRVVGYACAQINKDGPRADVGVVSYNAVDPDYQGQGIGTALCERVISHLKEEGTRVLAVWTLEADEPACRMYERQGFRELTRFVYYSMDVDSSAPAGP